jgi:ABC-2 type transport system permease protein
VNRILLNAQLQLDELFHIPAFAAPSIGLPLVSYVIFGLPDVHGDPLAASGMFVSFAAFALLGIVMFQFGVGIAADRISHWERYVRTLPSSATDRFCARLLAALLFGLLALVPLAACALLASPLHMDALTWVRVLTALLAGAVPLGLLGIMLGYVLSERGALPITNLLYLPLSYLGGLFTASTSDIPSAARAVAPWLPTRQWRELLVRFGLEGRVPVHAALALTGYGALFAVIAVLAYRRTEQREYR